MNPCPRPRPQGLRSTCNNLVLALILRYRRWTNVASALRYFTARPKVAIKALLAPG